MFKYPDIQFMKRKYQNNKFVIIKDAGAVFNPKKDKIDCSVKIRK